MARTVEEFLAQNIGAQVLQISQLQAFVDNLQEVIRKRDEEQKASKEAELPPNVIPFNKTKEREKKEEKQPEELTPV